MKKQEKGIKILKEYEEEAVPFDDVMRQLLRAKPDNAQKAAGKKKKTKKG